MASKASATLLSSVRATATRTTRGYVTVRSTAGARPLVGKLVVGLVVAGAGVWTLHSSDWSPLLSSRTLLADAAAKVDQIDPAKPGAVRDMPFPVELKLATPGPLLTLVGLGVRTVSFLRVKVYSAGFYLQDAANGQLHNIPGWHSFTAQHLLVPPTKSTEPVAGPQLSGEALMRNLIDRPVACAVRIVPVRNTDFSHLRDGFTRAIAARQKLARQAGEITEADEEALKAIFPPKSVPKGKSLVMVRTPTGALVVEYEGQILGQVNDPWVSRELMLAYFADKDVISPKLKEDVARGLERLVQN